jgi:acetyl-CoA carboxylase biotin carboxyl carrier protein
MVNERAGGDATENRGDAIGAPGGATSIGDGSPPAGPDAAATFEGLADDLLPALIARLDSSTLGEVEVHTAEWRVRLRKAAGGTDRPAAAVSVAGTPGAAGGLAAAGHDHGVPLAHELATSGAHLVSAAGALAGGGAGAGTAAAGARGRAAVAAPHLPVPTRALAGGSAPGTAAPVHPGLVETATVHVAISPAVGFLVVRDGYGPGRAVRAGEIIGHVDCLGVPRDVTAPEDGLIARNLAEQGEAVEYGQPLFDIEPAPPQPGSPQPGSHRPASSASEGR